MNKNALHLLESLLSYNFAPTTIKQWSHVALFKEYARRMAWWADSIGIVNNWITTNIVYVLELDDDIDTMLIHQLDIYLQSQNLYQPMSSLLQSALQFEMVSNHKVVTSYDLPNPYDALIKLYTRGGYIRWNQRGFWEVSGSFGISGMDIATYKIRKPFVSLDDSELDLIDNGDQQSSLSDMKLPD